MKKTGAQILCEGLIREGVEVIFGIVGGTVIPMYDAFSEYPQIRRILVRHEQAAAHAASGYAWERQGRVPQTLLPASLTRTSIPHRSWSSRDR